MYLMKDHNKRLKQEAKHQKDDKANLSEGKVDLSVRDEEMALPSPCSSLVDKAALAKPATVLTTSFTLSSQLRQMSIMNRTNQQLQASNIYTYWYNFGPFTSRLKVQHLFTGTMYKLSEE